MRAVLMAMLAVGVLAALYCAGLRYRVEQRNRRAEIVVDYAEIARLSSATGLSPRTILQRFKEAGVTAVAVTEDTLQTLMDSGVASPIASGTLTGVQFRDAATMERAARQWTLRGVRPGLTELRQAQPSQDVQPSVLLWAGSTARTNGAGASVAGYAHFRGSLSALAQLGVGLPPDALADVRSAGLRCVARIGNFAGASLQTMSAVLNDLKSASAEVVIFSGTEVFGHYGLHKEAADAFERSGMLFGQVEFGKQKGDERLASALQGRFVRVHSISDSEMGTLSEDEAIDRFVRAVRERNIRLCYVRLVTFVGEDALERNLRYLGSIVRGMGRGGLIWRGPARPFEAARVPVWSGALIGLGVGAMTVWLALSVIPGVPKRAMWWTLLVLVACAGLAALGDTGRKLVALFAAVVAPTLACLPLVRMVTEGGEGQEARGKGQEARGEALVGGVWALVSATLVTSLGIISVVGLLASRPFMVKASQFLGIKVAHALPILLVGILLITGLPQAESGTGEARKRMIERARRFLSQPVLVGALALTMLILVALVLAVARTGNEPGVGVSGLELRARALLDTVLPIRPRTKEFLLGHPAFIVAFGLAMLRRRRWATVLAVIGVLGQVSVLNTFCHIHTPLVLSAMRVVVGLIAGAVVGTILYAVAVRWTRDELDAPTGGSASSGAGAHGAG
jgi:hypothetical protein